VVVTHAIEVRRLGFHFEDAAPALTNVSFEVAAGERVAIVGPNGAGKSTLLLCIAGVLPEQGSTAHGEGEVLLFGERVTPRSLHAVRRLVGLLFQDPDDQLFCPTVGEDVAYGPEQLGIRGESLIRRVAECLAQVGLSGFERRLPHRLSMGEKRRAALAGLLAYEPRLLVFDEPTSGLDPRGRRQLIDVLLTLPSTQILATHDLALAVETCPRTILLDEGRVIADGPTREILANDALTLAHGLERPSRDLPARLLGGHDEAPPIEIERLRRARSS
jgi:energy-coupling factor transporter ATP-binding protein EcfA2